MNVAPSVTFRTDDGGRERGGRQYSVSFVTGLPTKRGRQAPVRIVSRRQVERSRTAPRRPSIEPGSLLSAVVLGFLRYTRVRYRTDNIRSLLYHSMVTTDMDETLVRELLADHSRNPRNHGTLTDPDIEQEASNPRCVGPTHPDGDEIALTVSISDGTPPVVEAVRFTGRGCTLSQATASLLSEQMTGTPVPDVVEWDSGTLEDVVGMDLTPSRLQCAELALVAFRDAVEDY